MKYTLLIDEECEEEIILKLKRQGPIAEKIKDLIFSCERELVGYSKDAIVPIEISHVDCFTTVGGVVFAIVGDERLRLRERLYTLEERLGDGFVRISQSTIANVKKIIRFDSSFSGALVAVFENGYRDNVSRRHIKAVKERFGIKR